MTLRISEYSSTTHTGRVRRNNEDSLLVDPPLFAVADGMGGAQAGEIASHLAIQALRDSDRAVEGDVEGWLRRVIGDANRRVHERARADQDAAGMGSTVTVAVLDGDRVAFGHVGDSRAYLVRGGAIQQLSADHSLVAELVRAGRLTREEAEAHPQKSVITRVLGVGEDVVVDTWTLDGRPGDVVMICSDGLNLVGDERILGELGSGAPLEHAVRALVQAANDAGGDDNVTLVAFRLASEQPPEAVAPPAEAASAPRDTLDGSQRLPAAGDGKPAVFRFDVPAKKKKRGRLHGALGVVIAGGLVCAVVLGSFFGLRWAHFVGEDPATGKVAVFTGVPVELGGGQTLYKLVRRSRVDAASLPAARRQELFDHELRSRGDADRLIDELEREEP